MNKQQRLKQWIAALALAGFLSPVSAIAQDDAEARSRAVALAGEAITAKESGDLLTAKAKLEEVLKINPSDKGAQELLADVNKALLAKSDAAAAPAAPLSALDRVAEENLNLFREVDSAMIDAQGLASSGRFDEAVTLLDQASAALPANTAGQAQKERVSLLKQQILAARDSGPGGAKALAARAIRDEVRSNQERVTDARKLISEAGKMISAERFDDALAALNKAESVLPNNSTADVARVELKRSRSKLFEARYASAIDKRDIVLAEKSVEEYETLNDKSDSRAAALRADLESKKADPHYKGIHEVSPDFAAREKKADALLVKARAQYLYGDYLGALETYKDVLAYQPTNTEAKSFSIRIREILHEKSGRYNTVGTRSSLLEDLDEKWKLAGTYNKDIVKGPAVTEEDPILQKMKNIKLPGVTLSDISLTKAIEELGEQSQSYDKDGKGVNFVVIDPDKKNPNVSLKIREMTLDRVLEQVLRQANFSYTINNGIVEVRPDSGNNEVETEFFPLSNGAVVKMTGTGAAPAGGAGAASPFGGGGAAAGGGDSPQIEGLKRYFRSVGMEFDEAKQQGLTYDGQQLIVTHNRRTLERVRNILRRYSDVKQVAIETKFIEINQSNLDEIAANWAVVNHGSDGDKLTANTGNRTLGSAFSTNSAGAQGSIVQTQISGTADGTTGNVTQLTTTTTTTPIPNNSPAIPGQPNLGATNNITAFGTPSPSPFLGSFQSGFALGGYDVTMFIRAVEQSTGSDLMAAPSLTVKDGQTANIKIAQMLRYPESYSQIQSQVGGGSFNTNQNGNTGSSGGAVAITAGTPQDFQEKAVGVVMEVTPTVQADGESIELDLKPQITEFEGFVEYGGASVAVSGGTTVTVPSGFFQPVFSVREVATKVTVYDGATVVIGGLTREEVKTIHDKVPVLGDIPLVGKLFQSNGKTSSKKNLMIFVTANMISPTGSQLRGTIGGIRNGTTFANPTISSPSGSQYRTPVEAKSEAK